MRRVLLILVPMGIIAVLALMAISVRRGAPPRVVTLPNGMQVQVFGTAVGSATFTTEKPWHRQARKILPARWQSWIPSPTSGSCSSGTNSLTVYVRLIGPAGAAISGQPWENYTTQDDDGFTYQREGGRCTMGGGATMQMQGLILRTYPRRQSRFKLQLLDAKGAVLAKLDVENPVRGPFPEWKPLPLPQTHSNGPVTLTLEGLREGGSARYRYIRPKWNMTSTETNWSQARARSITLIDPTGNEGQWLSRQEKAWKICAQVFRERLKDFAADEYVAFTNVSVPGPGECVKFDHTAGCNGVLLVIHALGGPGTIANTNSAGWEMVPNHPGGTGHSTSSFSNTTIEEWSSLTPFLLIDAKNVQPNDEIRFQMRDDLGREVKLEDSGYNGSRSGGRIYMRRFNPPVDSKSLSFEIIVNRPLEFEFMVNPVDVKTAEK